MSNVWPLIVKKLAQGELYLDDILQHLEEQKSDFFVFIVQPNCNMLVSDREMQAVMEIASMVSHDFVHFLNEQKMEWNRALLQILHHVLQNNDVEVSEVIFTRIVLYVSDKCQDGDTFVLLLNILQRILHNSEFEYDVQMGHVLFDSVDKHVKLYKTNTVTSTVLQTMAYAFRCSGQVTVEQKWMNMFYEWYKAVNKTDKMFFHIANGMQQLISKHFFDFQGTIWPILLDLASTMFATSIKSTLYAIEFVKILIQKYAIPFDSFSSLTCNLFQHCCTKIVVQELTMSNSSKEEKAVLNSKKQCNLELNKLLILMLNKNKKLYNAILPRLLAICEDVQSVEKMGLLFTIGIESRSVKLDLTSIFNKTIAQFRTCIECNMNVESSLPGLFNSVLIVVSKSNIDNFFAVTKHVMLSEQYKPMKISVMYEL